MTALLRKQQFTPSEDKAKVESERNKKYSALKKEYFESHPVCERCGQNKACQIHHKARQKKENKFRFFMAVCPQCHTWIHDNSQQAKKLRYIFEYDPKREDIDENEIRYENQDD